jgi:SagB-type dehydrogenase family enzyme
MLGQNIFRGAVHGECVTGATFSSRCIGRTLDLAGKRFASEALGIGAGAGKPARGFDWSFGGVVLALSIILALLCRLAPERTSVFRFVFPAAGLALLAQFSTDNIAALLKFELPAPGLTGAFILAAALPLAMVFFGNIYCGWLCPFGALQEAASALNIFNLKYNPPRKHWRYLRKIKYLVFFALVFAFLITGKREVFSGDVLAAVFTPGNMDGLKLAGILLIISFFMPRFWCRCLCPSGAFLSFLNKISVLNKFKTIKKRLPIVKPGRCEMGVETFSDMDCLNCDKCRLPSSAAVLKDTDSPLGLRGHFYTALALLGVAAVAVIPIIQAALSPSSSPGPGVGKSMTAAAAAPRKEEPAKKDKPVYKDGVWHGSAKGFDDNVDVDVTVKDGKIQNVKIIKQKESLPGKALEKIPAEITAQNSPDVDVVTGATYTSKGVINAVKAALAQASGEIPVPAAPPAPAPPPPPEPAPVSKEAEPQAVPVAELPPPRFPDDAALFGALTNRRSTKAFNPAKELPEQELSNVLWAAAGVNRPDGKRTAPTAFNWQEIEIYAATKTGVHKYHPGKHGLAKISSEDVRKYCSTQSFAADAPVILILVVNYRKVTAAPGPELITMYTAMDTGYVSQNIYLYCASAGLSTCAMGSVEREALAKRIGLKYEFQRVMLVHPVGYEKSSR